MTASTITFEVEDDFLTYSHSTNLNEADIELITLQFEIQEKQLAKNGEGIYTFSVGSYIEGKWGGRFELELDSYKPFEE